MRDWYEDTDLGSVELQLQLLELLDSLSGIIEKAREIALLLDKHQREQDLN
jgi:hypothetical protein